MDDGVILTMVMIVMTTVMIRSLEMEQLWD